MTVRLRAHHLLCMLTYVGKGYTPDFCANYDKIAARLTRGEDIEIVAGPDDVCAPLLATEAPHCHNDSVLVRDAQAAAAASDMLGATVAPGYRFALDAALLSRFRAAFAAGTSRTACGGCEWSGLCDGIAGGGFDGTRLAGGR
ncbi:DUF1284 domain-containing protein [Kaistia nematophila]|uniref:DUF1284 domain-containing protein n=1 Tax=Kaistia nematophila TaxID=2994654 RepID=A0A9X3IMG0_9HYPH|nr:DUF1284 domain-containing protein [Kaistia nematophila]MCX5570872.1 DUF1284 domain-containing protein [Kaistia nematophila]